MCLDASEFPPEQHAKWGQARYYQDTGETPLDNSGVVPGQLALPHVEAAHVGAGEAEAGEHRHPAAQPWARAAQRG